MIKETKNKVEYWKVGKWLKKVKDKKWIEKFNQIVWRLERGELIGAEHELKFQYEGLSGVHLLSGNVLIYKREDNGDVRLIDVVDYHKKKYMWCQKKENKRRRLLGLK